MPIYDRLGASQEGTRSEGDSSSRTDNQASEIQAFCRYSRGLANLQLWPRKVPCAQHLEHRPNDWNSLNPIQESERYNHNSIPEDPPHHLPPSLLDGHTPIQGTDLSASHATHEAECRSTTVRKSILHLLNEDTILRESHIATSSTRYREDEVEGINEKERRVQNRR
jgi:hypothetical protein